MYNGIGLQTARGSGTNGYIQTNKFFVKPKTNTISNSTAGGGYEDRGITRKPNQEILEHDRKRQIQLKLLVLEDKLIEQGYTDDEISIKLDQTRIILESASATASDDHGPAKVSDTQTHQVAARKQKQMENLKTALGIVHEEEDDNKYVYDEKIDHGIDVKDDEKHTNVVELKRSKKKTREASSSSEDSDSDSESEREVVKTKQRKKTRGRSDSKSDSDIDIRKNKRKPSTKGSRKRDRDESDHVGKEKRLSSRRSSGDYSDDDAYDVDKYEGRYDIDDRWDGGSSKRDTSPIRETRYEKERLVEKTGRRRHDTDDDEESDKDIHHEKQEIERGRREEREVERGGRRRHDVNREEFNKKEMTRGEKRERVESRHDSDDDDDDDIPAKEKVEKGDSRKHDSRNEKFNNKEMPRSEKRFIGIEERKTKRVERSRHDSDDDYDDDIPTQKKVQRGDSRKHDLGNQDFNNKETTRGEKRQRDSEQGKKEKIESGGRRRYGSDDDDDVRHTKQKTERGGGRRQEDDSQKRMIKIPADRDERSNKNKTTSDHGEEKHLQDRKEIRGEEDSGVKKHKRDETYEKHEKGREHRPSSYRRDHEEEHGSKRTKYDSDKHDVRRSRH